MPSRIQHVLPRAVRRGSASHTHLVDCSESPSRLCLLTRRSDASPHRLYGDAPTPDCTSIAAGAGRLNPCAGPIVAAWMFLVAVCLIPSRSSATSDSRGVAGRARSILNQRCFQCHGLNGVARKNVFVLDRSRLVASKTVVPGDPNSLLLKMVETGAMPLGGPELSDDEKETLRAWVLGGAPDWEPDSRAQRSFISESAILTEIRGDLGAASDRTRPYLRYFSLANLYNAGVSDDELASYRGALSKLINSLSWHPEVTPPAAIDPTQTVYRIDLRDYNWTLETWDLLLASYPYGVRTSDGETIASFSGSRLPYLRADWFVANACLPPLYHDILGLPSTVQGLERMLAIDAVRDLSEEKNVARAGLRSSGVSQNNRVLERHVSQHGAYWKSFDFKSNIGEQNIFRDPLRFNAAGNEIIFSLPNGLQAYFLANAAGVRLNDAPITIVADRNNPDDPVIHNGRSCMSCHFSGMQSFKDEIRPVLVGMTTDQFDRDRALVIYPSQEVLDRLVEKDQSRFQAALGKTGSPLPTSANEEPVNALSRKFNAELPVSEAAAEAGLETPEFLARLSSSSRLMSQGFGQLTVSRGAIKRDVWERQFGDLVRELRLGDHMPGRLVGARTSPVNIDQFRPTTRNPTQAARLAQSSSDAVEVLRQARTIFITSRTIHFNPDDLANQLLKKPDFLRMGLTITKDPRAADLTIQVDRLVFTTEFPYLVVDTRTKTVVASGQVNSLFGTVPAKVAVSFMSQIRAARSVTSQ
jgi:mono/diheme cytochrome c family protein